LSRQIDCGVSAGQCVCDGVAAIASDPEFDSVLTALEDDYGCRYSHTPKRAASSASGAGEASS
jgi:hypothetical protein